MKINGEMRLVPYLKQRLKNIKMDSYTQKINSQLKSTLLAFQLFIMIIMFFICHFFSACSSQQSNMESSGSTVATDSLNQSPIMENQSEFIKREQNRLKQLLETLKLDINTQPPILPTEKLKAIEAWGYEVPKVEGMSFSVYLFENQQQHLEAFKILETEIPTDNKYVLTSSNGALLFFGLTPSDGTTTYLDDEFLLGDIAGAFSGVE